MPRSVLYALCAAAVALAIWLVLGTLDRDDSPHRASEPREGTTASPAPGKEGVPALPPERAEAPATDPADLRPIQPDTERGDLQAGIDDFNQAEIGDISDVEDAQPEEAGGEPRRDAPMPIPAGGGGGGTAPEAQFPPQGDPRVLRPLDERPAPSEATPIEPEPETRGNLADPDVQSSVLPRGPLPAQ